MMINGVCNHCPATPAAWEGHASTQQWPFCPLVDRSTDPRQPTARSRPAAVWEAVAGSSQSTGNIAGTKATVRPCLGAMLPAAASKAAAAWLPATQAVGARYTPYLMGGRVQTLTLCSAST